MAKYRNRFDKMFEGYEQRTFFDANGKQVTKMVYTGPRYVQQLEDRQRIIYKILFLVLFILGLGLTVISGILRVPANFALYVNIAEAFCIVSGVLTAIYIFMYVGAVKAMETYAYKRAHDRLWLLSLISGALSFIAAICSFIATLASKDTGNFQSWLCVILQLLSGACYIIIFILERRTEYIITESDVY